MSSGIDDPPAVDGNVVDGAAAAKPLSGLPVKSAVAIAYVVTVFMSAMDNQIVNVMLPTLGREFASPLASIQWAVVGYMVTLAIFIPPSGWLGDRFGTKRTFMIALVAFTLASAACGLAQTLPQLVAFRILQGAGAGLLMPIATTMLFREYPPSERARTMRLLIVPIMLGPVIAQPVGGLLVDEASWRWAFFLNVPIGLAAMVTSALYIVERRDASPRRLDALGLVLSAVGLSLFTLTFTETAARGWTSPSVLLAGPLGILALVTFVVHEGRTPHPILNLSLLRDRMFRATNVVTLLNMPAFIGMLFLAPVFLQQVQGETALAAGLTTFATAIGASIGAQTLGRLYGKIGPRRLTTLASLGLTSALLAFLFIDSETSLWWVRAALFVAGVSQGTLGVAVQTPMFSNITAAEMGSGSALLNAGRQASSAVGVALLTTIVATVGGGLLTSFHAAFVAAAGLATAGAVAAALLIHDEDAESTRGRPEPTRAERSSGSGHSVREVPSRPSRREFIGPPGRGGTR